jgi:hypothetical protein
MLTVCGTSDTSISNDKSFISLAEHGDNMTCTVFSILEMKGYIADVLFTYYGLMQMVDFFQFRFDHFVEICHIPIHVLGLDISLTSRTKMFLIPSMLSFSAK